MSARIPALSTAALAAALLVPAAAQAAPPWTAPTQLTASAGLAPSLAFDGDGDGVASVRVGAMGREAFGVRADGTKTWSRAASTLGAGPIPSGSGRTISLRLQKAGGADRVLVGWSEGTTSGTIGTLRPLRTVPLRTSEYALAAATSGDAAIAFVEELGGGRSRLWFTTRRAGGTFQTPRIIRGTGSQRSVSVSVNDRGRYVVAWSQNGTGDPRVEARMGRTSGRGNGLLNAGPSLGVARVSTLVTGTGRTTVAWGTEDGGEEQNEPTEIRAAVAPSTSFVLRPSTQIDRAADGALEGDVPSPSLAAGASGTTTIAYTLSGRFVDNDARTPVRVSRQDARAVFGAPAELTADGTHGEITASPDGTVTVPYVLGAQLPFTDLPLQVARRTSVESAFGAPEEVTTDASPFVVSASAPGTSGAPQILYVRGAAKDVALTRRAG
ncbi:hypothetical protein [Paraconexibacter algicola]|uniref:Uncharacterized protein n=1 Tax=Paraconexibacter algicola TaxID=2133960 RepID=A0A2T4UI30_9ACTN|nr:hypothetical protein [Paraconexibacter algicola]PTL58855.1 hypothetical protein C7Y72_03905 [Paraconexibacter algicola]